MPDPLGSVSTIVLCWLMQVKDAYGQVVSVEHGGRFLGQPTAHLREELIDALRYAEMAEKQIAWLTAENERLKTTCDCDCPHCTIYCDKIDA